MLAKACTKCGETKPHDQFGPNRKAADGLNWWCRSCTSAHVNAWSKANAERRAEHKKKWRDANYDVAREIEKKSYIDNHEKRLQSKREYAANNRPRYTHYANKRKAAKDRATPLWADTAAIVRVYEACAAKTIETGIVHHVDHIVPLQGKLVSGLHVQNNLQILPGDVNRKKYNKHE